MQDDIVHVTAGIVPRSRYCSDCGPRLVIETDPTGQGAHLRERGVTKDDVGMDKGLEGVGKGLVTGGGQGGVQKGWARSLGKGVGKGWA